MVTIEEIWKKVTQSWNKFEDWVATGLTGIWSYFAPLIEMLYDQLEGFWLTLDSAVEEFINRVEEVSVEARQALSDVAAIPDQVWDWIEGNVYSMVEDAKATVQGWIDVAISSIEFVSEVSVEWVNSRVAAVEGLVLGIEDNITSVVDSFNMLMDYFDDFVKDAIEKILDWLIETEEESEEYKKGV